MQFVTSALVQTTTYQRGTTRLCTTCFCKVFPGSWQFFLKGCRASHHGSKHSISPAVCLNHKVIHSYLINTKLYLNFSKYGDKLLVVKSLTNILEYACWCIKAYGNCIKVSKIRLGTEPYSQRWKWNINKWIWFCCKSCYGYKYCFS